MPQTIDPATGRRALVYREGSDVVTIHAYAPGNGLLSFVARYSRDVPGHRRSEAASPSPTREECEKVCPEGWEVFPEGPYFAARPVIPADVRRLFYVEAQENPDPCDSTLVAYLVAARDEDDARRQVDNQVREKLGTAFDPEECGAGTVQCLGVASPGYVTVRCIGQLVE